MTDDPKKVKLPDGSEVRRTPDKDDGKDLERDVDNFGAPLQFDAEGNLVGGKPPATSSG